MAGGGTIEGGSLSSLTRASVESFLAGHASLSAQLLAGESVSTAVATPGSAAQTHEGGADAARQLAEQVERLRGELGRQEANAAAVASAHQAEVGRLEQLVAVSRGSLADCTARHDALQAQLASVSADHAQLQASAGGQQQRVQALEAELQRERDEQTAAKTAAFLAEVAALSQHTLELEESKAAMEAQLGAQRSASASHGAQVASLQAELAQHTADAAAGRQGDATERAQMEQQLRAAQAAADRLEADVGQLRRDHEQALL
jgi:chromosome segregation ATPase